MSLSIYYVSISIDLRISRSIYLYLDLYQYIYFNLSISIDIYIYMYIYTFISTWVHTVIYLVFPAYINNISMRRWHFRLDFPIFGRLPRDVETTYAEGLAVGGVFVMLTMMYYLTTSKARSEIRWTKNWGVSGVSDSVGVTMWTGMFWRVDLVGSDLFFWV